MREAYSLVWSVLVLLFRSRVSLEAEILILRHQLNIQRRHQPKRKACGEGGRAETLNGLFDEWNDARTGLPVFNEAAPHIGTIDWLFQQYRSSRAYLEKVKPRSRRNYE
jgi:hypothetical protein